jgi:RIO kinase 1
LGKNQAVEEAGAMDEFIGLGFVEQVLGLIKTGKEANVYLCSGGSRAPAPLLAAKVYRSTKVRQFADSAAYTPGRREEWHRAGMRGREMRAMAKRSSTGRDLAFALWVNAEHETLRLLHEAGADVPAPYAKTQRAVLMEYFGDVDTPAPPLVDVELSGEDEARRLFRRAIENIELMLAHDRVHGDLSAYNILYVDGGLRLIDFPQAVDARFNPNARPFLERDIANVCRYFARYVDVGDAGAIARRMWTRFLRGEL